MNTKSHRKKSARSLQDHRSPLARARDEWLESAEGKVATSINILRSPNQQRFLENRLVGAFIAGAEAGEKVNANAFTQGYVCAVAALVAGHGADTMARDVLRCNTPKDWSIMDAYDHDILAKVGLAPRRRKPRDGKTVQKGN